MVDIYLKQLKWISQGTTDKSGVVEWEPKDNDKGDLTVGVLMSRLSSLCLST